MWRSKLSTLVCPSPGFAIDEAPACARGRERAHTGGRANDEKRERVREPRDPFPNSENDPTEDEPGLVAEPARSAGAPPALAAGDPDGRRLRLYEGVRFARRGRAE